MGACMLFVKCNHMCIRHNCMDSGYTASLREYAYTRIDCYIWKIKHKINADCLAPHFAVWTYVSRSSPYQNFCRDSGRFFFFGQTSG